MILFNNYIQIIIILYLIIAIGLYIYKPIIMFKNNKMKSFGVGKSKTIFYYPYILIISSFLLYIIIYQFYISKTNSQF